MTEPAVRVLLAEDEEHLGNILRTFLSGRGYRVTLARDGQEALEALAREVYDVAVLDVLMPVVDGLAVLEAARLLPLPPQVVVTTGNGTADTARAALRLGADAYVTKPYRMADIDAAVRRAWDKGRLARANLALRARLAAVDPETPFLTEYAPLRAVLGVVERAARSDAHVFVAGEPGTGRRHLARLVHAWSDRRDHPLLPVSCGAPDVERRLLGTRGTPNPEPGALELAASGTLVLEGVDRLPHEVQRLLAEPRGADGGEPVGPRLVATADAELRALVAAGRLVPELAARLGVVTVVLPPLRDRVVDIWPLAVHFLAGLAPGLGLDPEARTPLERHPWPGNVAELRAVMAVAAARARDGVVRATELPLGGGVAGAAGAPEAGSLAEMERRHLQAALERAGWRREEAAAALGVTPATLARKIRAHGLTPAPGP